MNKRNTRMKKPVIKFTEKPLSMDFKEMTKFKSSEPSDTFTHGIEHCPVYYPKMEEFNDPIAYIAKIKDEASKAGICKIVPPVEWTPKFSLDVQKFKFKTRKQPLNEIEGSTRASLNFMDSLQKFHALQGTPLLHAPVIQKKTINLYELYVQVQKRGGLERLDSKQWSEVLKVLGINSLQQVRNLYTKLLQPYVEFQSKQIKLKRVKLGCKHQVKSKVLYKIPPEANLKPKKYENVGCKLCGHEHNPDFMIQCVECLCLFHVFCVTPKLPIPRKNTEYYCLSCTCKEQEEFGFEDGNEYNLFEFQSKADDLKTSWFNKKPTEKEVESEFWRLMEQPMETLEVEYGADLHSSIHGSGFPTIERNPTNEYSKSGFNLNVLPLNSLLSNMQRSIPGVVVPWLYVGMVFSTFCWHTEDHNCYSINYQHWGDTKTWYGVPGEDAELLEDAMKKSSPQLFEQSPDLMYHITTMISPQKLKESNVRVYGCHQRVNEFVVTFPEAYHAGFNQGFNFNEAVNFATRDWIDFGLKAVKKYQVFRKSPCFSHDELLFNVALKEGGLLQSCLWLAPHIQDLFIRCEKDKQQIDLMNATMSPNKSYLKLSLDSNLDCDKQCHYCNCFCWFIVIHCEKHGHSTCAEHVNEFPCDCHRKTVYQKMELKTLQKMRDKIVDLASQPSRCVYQLHKMLLDHKNGMDLSIVDLMNWLQQAESIPCHIEEAIHMRTFIQTCQEWFEQVNSLRCQQKMKLDEVKNLVSSGLRFGMRFPELQNLKTLIEKHSFFMQKQEELCQQNDLDECRLFLQECQCFEIEICLKRVEKHLLTLDWRRKVCSMNLCFETLQSLILEAQQLKIDQNLDLFMELMDKKQKGDEWTRKATEILGMERVNLSDLESLVSTNYPVPQVIQQRVMEMNLRIKDWNEQANEFLQNNATATQLKLLLSKMHSLPVDPPPSFEILSLEMRKIEAWSMKTKRIFYRHNLPKSLESILNECFSNFEKTCNINSDVYQQMDSTERNLFCFCRQPDSGYMLGCEICGEFYHTNCIRITKREAKKMTYVCPMCDLTLEVPRRCPEDLQNIQPDLPRPTLQELQQVVDEGINLKFKPMELSSVLKIHELILELQNSIHMHLQKRTLLSCQTDVSMLKFYLRKAEGCDIKIPEVYQLRSLLETLAPCRAASVIQAEKFCLCQKPSSPLVSMICCDECQDWFHFPCVNVNDQLARNAMDYICPVCCFKKKLSYALGKIDLPANYPALANYLLASKSGDKKPKKRPLEDKKEKTSKKPRVVKKPQQFPQFYQQNLNIRDKVFMDMDKNNVYSSFQGIPKLTNSPYMSMFRRPVFQPIKNEKNEKKEEKPENMYMNLPFSPIYSYGYPYFPAYCSLQDKDESHQSQQPPFAANWGPYTSFFHYPTSYMAPGMNPFYKPPIRPVSPTAAPAADPQDK